jgi:hypothetical protein
MATATYINPTTMQAHRHDVVVDELPAQLDAITPDTWDAIADAATEPQFGGTP